MQRMFRLAAVLVFLLAVTPTRSFATPVLYDIAFNPSGGTASFEYDATTHALTHFSWDFGGIVGGINDLANGTDLFDLLTIDGVAPCGVINVNPACTLGPFAVTSGSAPGGGTAVTFSSAHGSFPIIFPPTMAFDGCNADSSSHCVQYLFTSPAPAPEPGSLALLGVGLAGLGFARRRKQ